ncbi:MAG: hypothetical protein JXB85_08505 [Anaerolineales bacterium]|nr:hypothetical protein [Anaerolineales bacterium]
MLSPYSPKLLNILSNTRDPLQDLFAYLDYVSERSVKRMTRTNAIPRADLQRLAKLLGIEPPEKDDWRYMQQYWVDFIDGLALRLGLISYDLEGTYRGYNSSGPSFIENYISSNTANIDKFLALSPAAQEKQILDTLIQAKTLRRHEDSNNNEFFQSSVLGSLDSFHEWGAATGLMPTLKFPEIRRFLLDVLKDCPAGQWVSTESLIAWLKANHPFFLIPKNVPQTDKWGHPITRYGNFHESKEQWFHDRKPVPDNAPDGFERVEGRYVERFLENIPLTMRFVDVAYEPAPYSGPLPSYGMLKAFRVNERFLHLMSGETGAPKITIQPNFEVVIESTFYPAATVRQVAPLGEQMSSATSGHGAYVGIFHLNKTSVAAAQVKNPDLDVAALLTELSEHDLPPNVQVELEEWAGHADQFILYEGVSLLESTEDVADADGFTIEHVSPTLRLVRNGEQVFSTLEMLDHVPLRVQHPAGAFAPIAESAVSMFPKESAQEEASRAPRQVRVSRAVTISYKFPDAESFDSIQKMLAELRCPFQSDPASHTISIQQEEQGTFDKAAAKLAGEYIIDLDG